MKCDIDCWKSQCLSVLDQYSHGDLVFAKLGRYLYWPAVVSPLFQITNKFLKCFRKVASVWSYTCQALLKEVVSL